MGFWNEALLSSGHRHVEAGSRGQEAAEENAKKRGMEVRREWAGQAADRGTDKALEELFYGNCRNLGVSLSEKEKKKIEESMEKRLKVTALLGEAAPYLSVSWPRK